MANELTYFPVTGNWIDVENPSLTGSSSTPVSGIVSAFVLFTPRLPPGFVAYVTNLDNGLGVGYPTAVPITPIAARILSGQLETIDASDTVGVQLLANTAILNLAAQGITNLIYDVSFSQIVFAENNLIPGWQPQLTNFAFTAPTTNTPICITDPNLVQLAYGGTAPTFQLPSNVSTFGATLLNATNEAAAQGLLGVQTTTGTSLLKGNGTGGYTNATPGTDYLATVASTNITDATTTGKALLTAANVAAAQSTLSLTPGTNVQAYNANTYITGGALGTPSGGTLSNCTGSPSLTNATLTTPTLSGNIAGTYTLGGTPTFPAIPASRLPNGITNFNISAQSQLTVATTKYYINGSALALPATLLNGMIANKTTFMWDIALNKDANGTGTFSIILFRGTNGNNTDTADVTQSIGTMTAAADQATLEIQLTITTTGGSGAYYWSIIPTHLAAAAAGFGTPLGATGHFSGNVSSVNLSTASLIFGVGFVATAGGTMPTIGIPQVQATSYNLD